MIKDLLANEIILKIYCKYNHTHFYKYNTQIHTQSALRDWKYANPIDDLLNSLRISKIQKSHDATLAAVDFFKSKNFHKH